VLFDEAREIIVLSPTDSMPAIVGRRCTTGSAHMPYDRFVQRYVNACMHVIKDSTTNFHFAILDLSLVVV